MFSTKKSALFISREKVHGQILTLGSKKKVIFSQEYDWNASTLLPILLKLKKKLGKHICLLLSEEFVYLANIVGSQKVEEREEIKQKAQEMIPEDLGSTQWDMREILLNTNNKKITKLTQVIVLTRSFLDNCLPGFQKSGFVIDIIEPLSFALAHQVPKVSDPLLLVHIDKRVLFVLIQQGLVLTTSFEQAVSSEKVGNLLTFAQEKYGVKIKVIYFTGNIQSILPQTLVPKKDIQAGVIEADPYLGIARESQSESAGKTHFPNFSLDVKVIAQNQIVNSTSSKPQSRNTLFVIVGFISIILAIAGILFLANKNAFIPSSETPVSKGEPTKSITLSPKPTEEVATQSSMLNLSDFPIIILNASAREGEAAKLRDLLEEKGYTIEKIGNADEVLDTTEVLYNKNINQEFKLGLDKMIKSIYANTIEKLLSDQEVTTIVIGKE